MDALLRCLPTTRLRTSGMPRSSRQSLFTYSLRVLLQMKGSQGRRVTVNIQQFPFTNGERLGADEGRIMHSILRPNAVRGTVVGYHAGTILPGLTANTATAATTWRKVDSNPEAQVTDCGGVFTDQWGDDGGWTDFGRIRNGLYVAVDTWSRYCQLCRRDMPRRKAKAFDYGSQPTVK